MDGWWTWPAAFAGMILAVGVIWRQFLHPIVKAANTVIDAAPPLLALSKHAPAILATYAEFKPNGGTSLHDVIHRVDRTITDVDARLSVHIKDDKLIQETLRADGLVAIEIANALKADTAAIAARLDVHTTEVSDGVTSGQDEILAALGRLESKR